MCAYRDGNRRSRVRPAASLIIRKAALPRFSERDILAAYKDRSWCGLGHEVPVLNLHFSPGLARHTGQRTDNICLGVRLSGTAIVMSNLAGEERQPLSATLFCQLRCMLPAPVAELACFTVWMGGRSVQISVEVLLRIWCVSLARTDSLR